PGSINVPVDGRFAETTGMVLTPEKEVVVIAADGRHAEVIMRLGRIGFDNVAGYVPDPEATLLARADHVQRGSRVTPVQLSELLADEASAQRPIVVDVRKAAEREEGFIPGSIHIPLAELRRRLAEVPDDRPVVVYCAGGWRSSVAAS